MKRTRLQLSAVAAVAAVVTGVVLVASCGDDVVYRPAEPVVLGTFEGTVDPRRGLVDVHMVELDEAAVAALSRQQPLTAVTEDKNGVRGTAASVNTIEFAVECSGSGAATCAPPFSAPRAVVGGCGAVDSFELDVTVRSFFPGGLRGAYTEFTSIQNTATPSNDNTICNSDPLPRNLTVSGAPLNTAFGLYRYGQLVPNASAPTGAPALAADFVHWKFRNPGGAFKFVGRVVAQPCNGDCTVAANIPQFWEAEGALNASVDAAAEGNGVVYVGGSFNYVGPRTGSAAALASARSATPGEAATTWPPVEGGQVNAAISDGAGGVFLGGSFTTVGASTRATLAHILSDGSLDTAFTPTVTGSVSALALAGARLIVGGTFTQVNGTARTNLAAIDATTGALDAGWRADANGDVLAVAAVGGSVVVGGTFTTISNGTAASAPRIARVSAATGAFDATFTSRLTVNNGAVNSFVIGSDGVTLFFGGTFNGASSVTGNAGPVSRSRLAAVNLSTVTLSPFAVAANADVNGLARIGDTIYIVGNFTALTTPLGSSARARAGAASEAGVVTAWRPAVDSTLFAVAADTVNNDVYLGGVQSGRLTAVDGAAGSTLPWSVAGNNNQARASLSAVRALVVSGSVVYVGGGFRSAGGVTRLGLAVWDLATGEATAAAPYSTQQAVTAIAVFAGGDAIVGTATSVDRVTAAGAIVWSRPTNGPVLAVAVDAADRAYVGGTFTTLNGSARGGLAALDSAGTLLSWQADATGGAVRALAVYDEEVYVGGDFTALAGNGANARLATLNLATGAASVRKAWAPNNTVFALSPNRDFLFVGGAFSTIDGASRSRIAALDGSAVTAYAQVANAAVRAIVAMGNNLHVGGDLTTLGTGSCVRGCTQHIEGSARGAFSGGINAAVRTVAVAGDIAFYGGPFFSSPVTGGAQRTGVAVLFAD